MHSHRATAVLIAWSQKVLRLQELPKLNPNESVHALAFLCTSSDVSSFVLK